MTLTDTTTPAPTAPTALPTTAEAGERPVLEVEAVSPLRGRPRVRDWLHRELVAPSDLIVPVLVQPDTRSPSEFPDLPTAVGLAGVGRLAEQLDQLGIGAIKLFCYVVDKRPDGAGAVATDNVMVEAIKAVREAVPTMVIATEVCGCAWTTTGECVILDGDGAGTDLAATHKLMADMAVLHATAGADIVGPAAVLEGSVCAIRDALNTAGYRAVSVTPSVIFDSVLFGPYKGPMHTDPGRGHRRGLQIDGCQIGQAINCARRWLDEGADSLLVQPAMMAVDLLTRLATETNAPITAFSVSGEHLMLRDDRGAYLEYVRMLRRAGADRVMTYGATQLAADLIIRGEERP